MKGRQRHLHRYLQQVRASLCGCTPVDPQEVERDVLEHIETELQGKPEPISADDLEATLKKLGSPDQWVPKEELPLWRQIISRLRKGPEDWRLAYLSFGLLVIGTILILAIRAKIAALFVPLMASFCVSRAAVDVAGGRDEIGARRWLVYPSLIVVYLVLLCGLFLRPLLLRGLFEDLLYDWYREVRGFWEKLSFGTLTGYLTISAAALWWTIIGLLLGNLPFLPRSVFPPFADRFDHRWGTTIMFIGLGALILCAATSTIIFR